MTDTQVAAIALSLTRHARKALIEASAEERVIGSTADLLELCLSDLADVSRDNSVWLNDLGVAVRQHLTQSGDTINDR